VIHELKMTDNHFARLFNEYHELDHEVHRIETGAENTSDDYLEERKKARLNLKDQLFGMLKAHAAQIKRPHQATFFIAFSASCSETVPQ